MEKLITSMLTIESVKAKRGLSMERPARSLLKSVSWRIVATLTTVFLVYVFGKDLALATLVGITELVLKTIIYYVHERVWNLTNFGRGQKTK
jgi:uncharacterized membrane protein